MLCKNEGAFIDGCLMNLEPIADEFVIVDTGSTDDTLEKIEQFKKYARVPVRVFHREWQENFSWARNFAISQASSRWILHIDPDERIEHTELQLMARMLDEPCEAYLFQVINYLEPFLPHSGKKPVYATTETLRLFLNKPEIFYSGIVHETLEDALAARKRRGEGLIIQAPVRIHHHGYLKPKDKLKDKFDMYTRMNEMQIKVTEGRDPRAFFNLALHYLNENEEAKAEELMVRASNTGQKSWRIESQLATLYMKKAQDQLLKTNALIPEGHPFKAEVDGILKWMGERGLKQIKIDTA